MMFSLKPDRATTQKVVFDAREVHYQFLSLLTGVTPEPTESTLGNRKR